MISKFAEKFLDGLLKVAGTPKGAKEIEVEYEGKRRKPSPETLARAIGDGKGAKHTPIRGMLIRAKKWFGLRGRQRKFEALRSRVEGQMRQAKMDAADHRATMTAAGYPSKGKAVPFASMGQAKIDKLKARLDRLGAPAKDFADYAMAGIKAKYKNEEPLAFKLDQAKVMRKGLLYAGAAALPVVGGAALYATLRRKKDKKRGR